MPAVQVIKQHIVTPFNPDIFKQLDGAKQLTRHDNTKLTVAPHTLFNTNTLRSNGLDVPAPVLSQYDWAGLTPYEVQTKTVALMTTSPRCYVLNGLGTGKTRCSLWAFDFLRKTGHAKKMMVVAPLSTLNRTWLKEVFEAFPHLKCNVLFGTKAKRLKLLAEDADIYAINHDGVGTIEEELEKRRDINILVIDELAVYRNGAAARTKKLRTIASKMQFVWGLTGTPIPRSVTDVWGQASIVTPNTVPKYFNHLRQQLCFKSGPFTWTPKENAIEMAIDHLRPAVRYSLDDVVELPEVNYQYVEVTMGSKQAQVYKKMRDEAVALADNHQIDALNAGAVMSKLMQIALGWVYTRDGTAVKLDNDERIQAILDLVDSSEGKVIVFVPFKSAVSGIGEALTNAEIEYCTVTGDTPAWKRAELFGAFQDTPQYKVLLAHPQCVAHGLTLTAARTVIWAGPVTSLEIFAQACARVRRIGQRFKQLIVMLGGTSIERKVYKLLANNETAQNKFLDLLADRSM